MHSRLFRLIETHQRIDDALRQAQRGPRASRFEIVRLKTLKLRVKTLIHKLSSRPAHA